MPNDVSGERVPRGLEQCTDHQLAWLLMRELYRMYDHGGISSRCERSLVLESGIAVCQIMEGGPPTDISHLVYQEAKAEVDRRSDLFFDDRRFSRSSGKQSPRVASDPIVSKRI